MNKPKLIISLFLLVTSSVSAEGYLYVTSDKANVLSQPAFESNTVYNVTKYQKLMIIEKMASWYMISYDGKSGWLPRLVVSKNKPVPHLRTGGEVDEKLRSRSRRRASEVTTVAAIRGFTDLVEPHNNQKIIDNNRALDKMEGIDIKKEDVYAFNKSIKEN